MLEQLYWRDTTTCGIEGTPPRRRPGPAEKRRLRDGVVAVIAGAIFAKYGTPVGIELLDNWFGPLDSGNDQIRDSAAFAMGIGGMTFGKLIMAMFEKYAKSLKDGSQSR